MTFRPILAAMAAAAAFLAAGAAQAQSVMTPGAMPPPPSYRDTTKPAEGQAQKRRARKPAVQADGEIAADAQPAAPRPRKLRTNTSAPSTQEGGYSGRLDDRPQPTRSQGMQLEDDPRGVSPVLNNGRAGVGMRF